MGDLLSIVLLAFALPPTSQVDGRFLVAVGRSDVAFVGIVREDPPCANGGGIGSREVVLYDVEEIVWGHPLEAHVVSVAHPWESWRSEPDDVTRPCWPEDVFGVGRRVLVLAARTNNHYYSLVARAVVPEPEKIARYRQYLAGCASGGEAPELGDSYLEELVGEATSLRPEGRRSPHGKRTAFQICSHDGFCRTAVTESGSSCPPLVLDDRGYLDGTPPWRESTTDASSISDPWLSDDEIAFVTGDADSAIRQVVVRDLRSNRVETYSCEPGTRTPPRSRKRIVKRLCGEFAIDDGL